MAKKHGNWPFLCNFASMKQNLPDIIRENKDLLSAMLEQEGFMKYVAEHLDDDGLTLYARYQEQVVSDYRKSNMWNPYVQLLQGNELWLKALGPDNHLTKEQRSSLSYGSKLYITFPAKVMHLFDPVTEKSLIDS